MTGMDGISSLGKMLGSLRADGDTAAKEASETTAAHAVGTPKLSVTNGGLKGSTSRGTDHASLSLAGGLAAGSADTSDVRLTRVAELRQAIASGSYNVPAGAVADKMIESLLK